jgi:GNAT superfamily N-acetyltransferase
MDCVIRRAVAADAAGSCDVVRRSIVDLCSADHRGDEARIAAWIANKTPSTFEQWISAEGSLALVAEGAGGIVGFSLMESNGAVRLLYVLPAARFSGVSTALLAAMEREAIARGVPEVRLSSTETARRFYERRGYASAGAPTDGPRRVRSYPMVKRLSAV